MKKILFLSFAYPYGHFGPSDNCTVRIMDTLVKSGEYEIHNISCRPKRKDSIPHYTIINQITLHFLPFIEKYNNHSRTYIHLMLLLKLSIYPLTSLFELWKYYRECKRLLKNSHYDLVVAQCFPLESVIAGVLLKKNGYIDNLMVIFWDNIYGKLPRRVIPKRFALHRQYKVESWVARYADKLVSLYPIKSFHDEYGDVTMAKGKRVYLGIPSIIRPKTLGVSSRQDVIKKGKINILFSGNLFQKDYVLYVVELLNRTAFAEQVNLIFFSKGVAETDFEKMRKHFKGTIFSSGWIPLNDLLALYNTVDFFISFPGSPTAICSKVFDYMSYGKPIILFYDNDNDVNVATFSCYPYCFTIDGRKPISDNINASEIFINNCLGKSVEFEKVEQLFPDDSASAYLRMIEQHLTDK